MNYKIEWDDSILRWDEAVPLGSGKCGCLCWGTQKELRFSLDRTDIWERNGGWRPDGNFTYAKLRELAEKGDTEKIREIFDAPYNQPAPTKLSPGKLLLSFSDEEEGGVSSRLELGDASAHLTVRTKQVCCGIRAWVHALRNLGILEVEAPPGIFAVRLLAPEFGVAKAGELQPWRDYDEENRQISQGSTKLLCYPPAKWGEETDGCESLRWFIQPLSDEDAYAIVVGQRGDREGTRIVWNILSSRDGSDWLEKGTADVRECLRLPVKALFEEHARWWREFWKKSSLCLPDKELERQWYMTNYLFAACSRKGYAPMPLQGVWTADDGMLPPWKGDYHHDLNTELSYSHYLKANHLEEGRCFPDFLWGLLEEGKSFAESFYGTKGCCLPAVMTIDGRPLGGWPMYSLSPTNQIWLCQSFVNYVRYTGDMDFLRERAYPYVRETGICMEGLLTEGEDGMLRLPISSSPEIHDDTADAWLTPVSNYDLALLHYLFDELDRMAAQLFLPEQERWRGIRRRLPELTVNEKGVLMLSPDESLEESHRHFSNAIAISPLERVVYEGRGKEIIDAVISDYERLGTSWWVGYSFPWMAHLYAIAGKGEKAAEMLGIFRSSFCGPNGFHLNGDYKKAGYSHFTYRLFTLEGNMFAASALQEMLLQSKEGEVRLFPAVPEEWKKEGLCFSDFRCVGGLLCSASMESAGQVSWRIYAAFEQEVSVVWGSRRVNRRLLSGETWEDSM